MICEKIFEVFWRELGENWGEIWVKFGDFLVDFLDDF